MKTQILQETNILTQHYSAEVPFIIKGLENKNHAEEKDHRDAVEQEEQ